MPTTVQPLRCRPVRAGTTVRPEAPSVVPGQSSRLAGYRAGEQMSEQLHQSQWVDRLAGRAQLLDRPPPVADQVSTFQRLQPAGIDLMAVHAMEEEVVSEHAGGPTEIGVPGGLGDCASERLWVNHQTRAAATASDSPSVTPPPGVIQYEPRSGWRSSLRKWKSSSRPAPSTRNTRAERRR